jgi:hypothetical protein
MQTRLFIKTFDTGFYIEWEQPKGSLWSLYIWGKSSIAGRIGYDHEDYKVFREGWKVQEYEVDLKGCTVEVFDPEEKDTKYKPEEMPEFVREALVDAMIEIVEREY